MRIRKLVTIVEEVRADGGRPAARPVRKAAALAVTSGTRPRPDEIVVALLVTDGGRPHPRVAGLTRAEARREDGRR